MTHEPKLEPRRRAAVKSGTPPPGCYLSGDTGMWVFVLGDLVIFGVYFIVFMVLRAGDPRSFLSSQRHLDLTMGALNTLVLLTSSWLVALAVQSVRTGEIRRATGLVYGAGGCGLLFLLIKAEEWHTMIGHGFTLTHNDFFMFYYMLTGAHLLHVLIGILVLALFRGEIRDPRLRRMSVVEATATYWHMVDLLWVVIFALLYVMR
ncbi:cytochrome c oxidase subunit 3 family protein [Streptomyces cylindrosporus]|uniref:Cytochrome aa3 subunit 3 n=1 Tax=Streptomyces cylindrosporus TaxID=2927583 RepID=A0ABS9YA95_9ACTN|nr:cytochrome c oxidase subunit 3 family protein [Streptomyces cylindrosporus]MCI3273445.1 cytochrome c oxidase subunit 3 family protein [Streptomyces cylindrosporus]